jgi:sporulation protein YlmC with PRC-barrel domain
MKRLQGAVAGVMVLALSGAAFAQGMRGNSDTNASSNPGVMSATDISRDYKASELKGMSVHNHQNQKLGTISDLIIGKDGKVSSVVLHEGGVVGLGGKSYLVPWDRVQLNKGEKVAFIDVNKDRLSSEFSAMEENKGAGDKNKEKEKEKDKDRKKTGTEKSEETGKPTGTSPPAK